mmetsp:Transcript_6102/g.25731  ORF Transcript_6102/g.25731 Transcript_6102/m.25731 type:complete len:124 (-) Transcript_6102:660-1031(-)
MRISYLLQLCLILRPVRPRRLGSCHVQFSNEEEAKDAVRYLSNTRLDESVVFVSRELGPVNYNLKELARTILPPVGQVKVKMPEKRFMAEKIRIRGMDSLPIIELAPSPITRSTRSLASWKSR